MTERALRPVIEVGFGSGPADPDPTWTDITDLVWGEGSGPVLDVVRGRSGERAQISPGTASFVLDNTDGVFDPDNEAGPFHGLLVDGVPIRVRAASSATTEVVWRGWVEAWPQVDSRSARTVEVDCLDVVGLLAQGDAPTTAFEAEVLALGAPDTWWRAGPSGWLDRASRLSGRHSSSLAPAERPMVDGDESFESDGDGFGKVPRVLYRAGMVTAFAVVFRVSNELPPGGSLTVLHAPANGVQLVVRPDGVDCGIRFRQGHEVRAADVGIVGNLADGQVHVAVVRGDSSGSPTRVRLWVDGTEVPLGPVTSGSVISLPPGVSTLDPHDTDIGRVTGGNEPGFLGAIDHLVAWGNVDWTAERTAEIARTLTDQVRLAWAGQRLDERLTGIAVAMNVDGLLGDRDVSGIITRHGYRQGNPLDLLQKIEDTEQGRIWVDRHGRLRFANRRWPSQPQSASVQAWFSDDPADLADGALPMSADHLQMGKDPRRTTNVAQVTSEHGRMQTWEDHGSIAVRGRRNPVHLSGLMHSSDRASLAIAQFIVATSSEPTWRVDSLIFRAEDHPDLAALAQQIEEGWLVKVTRAGRDVLGHVTSIAHHVDQWGWQVTIALDSTRAGASFWRADLSTTDGPDVAGF